MAVFIGFSGLAAGVSLFQLLVYPMRYYNQYGVAAVLGPVGMSAIFSFWIWALLKSLQVEKQHYLFKKFAADNGLLYQTSSASLLLPGMLFACGNQQSKRRTNNLLSGVHLGQKFTLGNQHFENFAAGRLNTFDYGFIAVKISRTLPQMLLRSKRKAMEFTSGFKSGQVLELEGNFGAYFTLYCPKDFERDAFYVLTPDLMVLLIDYGADFDIEINGNYVFFYHRPFIFDEKQTAELFAIIATLGNAVFAQTKRYNGQLSWIPGASHRLKEGIWGLVALNVLVVILILLRLVLLQA